MYTMDCFTATSTMVPYFLRCNTLGCSEVLKLQKSAVRDITPSAYLDHCKPLFRRLVILTVCSQFVLSTLDYFRDSQNGYNTREELYSFNTRGTSRAAASLRLKSAFPVLALKCLIDCQLKWSCEQERFFKVLKTGLVEAAYYYSLGPGRVVRGFPCWVGLVVLPL